MDHKLIRFVSRYESKLILRGGLFQLFVWLLLALIFYKQYILQGDVVRERWEWVALSSAFPFMNASLFNLLQTVVVIFIMIPLFLQHKTRETRSVLEVRPVSNVEYFAGRLLALFYIFES